MKTEFALLLQYERPTLTGEEVANLLGIGERTLENRIYKKECPIPMFKMGSKWAAHVSDVAAYIDSQRAEALKELDAANDRRAA
jgi:excisionase family DNA binding protein